MKILKGVVVLLLLVCAAFGLWYFQPWNEYSPSSVAKLQDSSRYIETFRNMDDYVPSRVVPKGSQPRNLEKLTQDLSPKVKLGDSTLSFETWLKESATTGLLVLKDGKIIHEQYREGADETSLFTSWSVAKSFVATAVMMAIKEGKIQSWDDLAQTYAPQYSGTDFGNTSIKALLAMSSGIEFNEDYVSDDSDIRPFFFDSFVLGKNPDSLLSPFARTRPELSDFEYISPNSHVLSAVLRGVYQQSLAQIISEKIWQPMGMEADATWLQQVDGEQGQALGYCCLNARLRDYARFGQFYLETFNNQGWGPQALPMEWVQSLTEPATPAHESGTSNYGGRGYSWHFWLPETKRDVFMAMGVYNQVIWIEPAKNLVIVKTSADLNFLQRFRENEAGLVAISNLFE